MAKSAFKDPIAVKSKNSSFTFAAPSKEVATTGYFMSAGDDYGVGHKNPIGHDGKVKERVETMPMTNKAFTCSEVIK